MPTTGAGINGVGVLFETSATDQINAPSYGTTKLNGFAITFEMSASDRRYLETTAIKAFGVSFEYSLLYAEEIF